MMRRSFRIVHLLGLTCGALVILPLRCVGASAVGGTIHDDTGGSVPGAKVILTEKFKGLVHTSETETSGSFLFPSVLAGTYTLSAEKSGFRTYRIGTFTLEVGETASLSIILTV